MRQECTGGFGGFFRVENFHKGIYGFVDHRVERVFAIAGFFKGKKGGSMEPWARNTRLNGKETGKTARSAVCGKEGSGGYALSLMGKWKSRSSSDVFKHGIEAADCIQVVYSLCTE